MNCEEARIAVSKDLDRELPAAENALLAAHLAECAACAAFAADCRQVQEAIRRSSVPMPDDGYWHEAFRRVRVGGELAPAGVRRLRILCITAWAACALLAVGAMFLWGQTVRLRAQVDERNGTALAHRGEPGDLNAMVRMVAAAPGSVIREQSEAFRILTDYFQGGVRWLAQDGAQSEIGVAAQPGAVPASAASPLVLELRLLKADGEGPATVLSAPQLFIRPGEEANFRLAGADGAGAKILRYRCQAELSGKAETLFSAELEIAANGGAAPVRLSGAARLGAGVRVPLAYTRSGDAAYLLVVWSAKNPVQRSHAGT